MATIKKGTYRWNDEVDLTLVGSFNLIFTCEPLYYDGVELFPLAYFNGLSIEEGRMLYDGGLSLIVYSSSHKWNNLFEAFKEDDPDADVPIELKGYGQTFTVTEDTDVDDTFGTWFSASTSTVGSGATVTYDGRDLVTIATGETVTLKCAGLKMKTDVVIKM